MAHIAPSAHFRGLDRQTDRQTRCSVEHSPRARSLDLTFLVVVATVSESRWLATLWVSNRARGSLAGPDSKKIRVWANSHSNLVLHCQQSPALLIIFIVNNSIVFNYRSKKFLDPLEPNRYASLPRLLFFQSRAPRD